MVSLSALQPLHLGLLAYGLDRPLSGIGRYTVELARALVTQPGLAITLLTAGEPLAFNGAEGLGRAALPGCSRLPALLTLGSGLMPTAARRARIRIIHDPTGVAPFLFGAAGARIIVTVHDVIPWAFPGASTLLDTLIYRHWLPRVISRAAGIVTVSETSRRDIVRFLAVPAERIYVVPEGVSACYQPAPPEAIADVRARYHLPDDFILYVGSAEPRKNLSRLIEACRALWSRGEGLPLVIAGARQEHGKEDEPARLIRLGYVPEVDLPALYSAARAFVFPSLYEGFGLPPLEAMACGTPVVCSNTSSIPEVVGEAALTVDPYNIEALAAALQRVLKDEPLRAELRARGLARAAAFTWERVARETLRVYEHVLAQP
jgi:glycosyltransferase involved in cell wall biosynthesis